MDFDDLHDWPRSAASGLRSPSPRLLLLIGLLVAAAVAIPLLLSHPGKASALAALPSAPSVTVPTEPSTPAPTVAAGRGATGPAHDPFVQASTSTGSSQGSGSVQVREARGSAAAGSTAAKPASSGARATATTPTHATAPRHRSGAPELRHTRPHPSATTPTHTTSATTPTHTTSAATPSHTSATPTTTIPAVTAPFRNYEAEISLRQEGVSSPATVFHHLNRDQLLPSDQGAFAAFLGLRTDRRTAVFALDPAVRVSGQGSCVPSVVDCSFLSLRPGQRATLRFSPAGGGTWSFVLADLTVTEVSSSASLVETDPAGAAAIASTRRTSPRLAHITYGRMTGLLSIDLGRPAEAR